MGGFFGTVSKAECVTDLFYGTDYNSHLGTKRAGMATYDESAGFARSIHSIDNSYFRTKFESELSKFKGKSGIGVISDTDPQPIMINSHLGRFAIVTVAKINNIPELEKELLDANMHFAEMSMGKTNPTELVALLIVQGKNFVDGIENVYNKVKGSCSMLLLTEDGIIAARDRLGRTPIIVGKKEGAYAVTSESCSLPNLDYEIDSYIGPGEIVLQLLGCLGKAVEDEATLDAGVEGVLEGEAVGSKQHLHALLGGHVLQLHDIFEHVLFGIVLAENNLSGNKLDHLDVKGCHFSLLVWILGTRPMGGINGWHKRLAAAKGGCREEDA